MILLIFPLTIRVLHILIYYYVYLIIYLHDTVCAVQVSVGSGIYPAEELGKIDVQDFLYFGKQWLNFHDTVRRRAKNLIQLLGNAVSMQLIVYM